MKIKILMGSGFFNFACKSIVKMDFFVKVTPPSLFVSKILRFSDISFRRISFVKLAPLLTFFRHIIEILRNFVCFLS